MKKWFWLLLLLPVGLIFVARAENHPQQTDPLSVLPIRQLDVVHLRQAFLAAVQQGSNPETALVQQLTPQQADLVKRFGNMPDGPQRYADTLLVAIPDLSDTQRAMLTPLLHTVEATPAAQKRFWRLAYLILTPDQARALTPQLPLALQHGPNPLTYFGVPGLTASQANRIRARFTELEAAMQPRTEEAKALEQRIASAPKEEQIKLQIQMLGIQEGIISHFTDIEKDLATILTPEQKFAQLEVPPLTEPQEMGKTLGDLMDGVQLAPEQQQKVQPLVGPLQTLQAETEKKAKGLEGPDGMEKMMAMHGLMDTMQTEQLRVARQIVPILTDAQRTAWISK